MKVYARVMARSEREHKAALEKQGAAHQVHGDEVAMMQSGHAAEVDQLRNDLEEELAASGGVLDVARVLLTADESGQVMSADAVKSMGKRAAKPVREQAASG